jgi:hypothetical protein
VRLDLGFLAQPSLLDHLKAQWETDREAIVHGAAPHSLFAGNEQLYRKAVINKFCRIPNSGLSPIDELQAGFLFHMDITCFRRESRQEVCTVRNKTMID